MKDSKYVLGVDFGTDSVRAVVVNCQNGKELAQEVYHYPRWREGRFCDAARNQFRQHPKDYLEGLERSICGVLERLEVDIKDRIVGIGVDTTGSTPVAVDKHGTPLALLSEFADNPNAMFILWKDHTGINEAEEINKLCRSWEEDYSSYSGGIYSSEWFWAKILHTVRVDEKVAKSAYSWVEHCDWIPYHLTGADDIRQMKRSRCAAGHKAMWHPNWGGLPPEKFLEVLDPALGGLRERLYQETYTSDQAAGKLSTNWAKRLGLSQEVVVAVGAFDAHMGAVGGQIEPYHLSKVMGTSTCDMLIAPLGDQPEKLIAGICGQVDGSVIPGMLGMEAGQSAFGDVYAWFKQVLLWPLEQLLSQSDIVSDAEKQELLKEASNKMIPVLSLEAEKIALSESTVLALDWLNGRRTPDADQSVKGAIMGLDLSSSAPKIFRALIEATCFGARAIVERFRIEGIPIHGLIGLGGVAQKSPFIMQTMANIMNMPIKIAKSEQTCALGAAMFAATASGLYSVVTDAMEQMGAGFAITYHPDNTTVKMYEEKFQKYLQFGMVVNEISQTKFK